MEKLIYSIVLQKNKPGELDSLLAGLKGIHAADLSAVSFDDISVVICDINKADFIADQSSAIEYAGVIEKLAHHSALLPVRFGSTMGSTEAIRNMLERNYSEILQNLQKVENKVEFGLKVLSDPEQLQTEMRDKSETSDILASEACAEGEFSVFREYVNKKLREHRLEELLLTYVDSVIAEIYGSLAKFNVVAKFTRMSTPATIIDGVFLLDKGQKELLIQTAGDFQKRYPELSFILTGPWPPYNFVDFNIK
jgi:hypothetical protein